MHQPMGKQRGSCGGPIQNRAHDHMAALIGVGIESSFGFRVVDED